MPVEASPSRRSKHAGNCVTSPAFAVSPSGPASFLIGEISMNVQADLFVVQIEMFCVRMFYICIINEYVV